MTSAQLPLFEDPEQPPGEITPAAVQLTLELPPLVSFGLEDFLVSHSNAKAAALVESWPQWPQASVGISGPAGSGKTHLARAWQTRSHASCVEGIDLTEDALGLIEPGCGVVIENIDRGIGDERVLFHVLNTVRERGAFALLTSTAAPGDIEIALPDLRSRLRALPLALIEPPDDAVLQNVLVKHFADRQLAVVWSAPWRRHAGLLQQPMRWRWLSNTK
jgi:chromosomal replication initiation ATPase DnaA